MQRPLNMAGTVTRSHAISRTGRMAAIGEFRYRYTVHISSFQNKTFRDLLWKVPFSF
jgi:hypothetical protein